MKKKKDQNKLSFREAFKRNYRAFLLVNKSCPGMFFHLSFMERYRR